MFVRDVIGITIPLKKWSFLFPILPTKAKKKTKEKKMNEREKNNHPYEKAENERA